MRKLLLVAILAFTLPAHAVTLGDWALIGNPGNPPDTASNCYGTNCGSVDYNYYILKNEVTNAQYAEFLNAKAASDPLDLWIPEMEISHQGGITRSGVDGSYTYSVKPGFADKPATAIWFFNTLRFANWVDNGMGNGDTETGAYTLLGGTRIPSNWDTVSRNPGATVFLPSENEWYKAAYYSPAGVYFDYPAGIDTQMVCALPGATANTANCFGPINGVTDTGAYTGSASPYGTFDQGGNVWEWNEEIVGSGGSRGWRGGAYDSQVNTLAANSRDGNNPTFTVANTGFRIALIPEPGTGLLLLIGLAGLAVRCRHPAN